MTEAREIKLKISWRGGRIAIRSYRRYSLKYVLRAGGMSSYGISGLEIRKLAEEDDTK